MSITRVVSGSLAVLMLASLMIPANSAGDDLEIGVGDYWKYSFEAEEEGMIMDGSLEMKVDKADTLDGKEVFYLEMSGSGEVSGTMEGMTISGTLDLEGEQVRLRSDFDVISEDGEMTMEIGAMGISMDMTMGYEMEYSPSMDDFIGDGAITLNSVQTSEFNATAEYWTTILGQTESDSETVSGDVVMTVVDESIPVTVPAGTFDCCKVKVERTMNASTETVYWYYSDEVGFYVKQDMSEMGLVDLELEDYSFGEGDDGGIVSMFTGDNLWLTLLIIVVIVVIVAVAIAMRSRRGKVPTPMTPPQPDVQVPPPPGPGQPQAPPPGQPAQPPQSPPTS
ncbi:MAG: hypothetical protein JSV90_06415 [Methanobacteriota archaeon]|nr:MAG: hypothetical protein JSV90_06415 [Euryarchaeota archaeon]